jgi:hypothetical protein
VAGLVVVAGRGGTRPLLRRRRSLLRGAVADLAAGVAVAERRVAAIVVAVELVRPRFVWSADNRRGAGRQPDVRVFVRRTNERAFDRRSNVTFDRRSSTRLFDWRPTAFRSTRGQTTFV